MKIATQLRLQVLGFVVATAIPIGLVMSWGYTALIATQQRENLERQAENESSRLEHAFGELKRDALVLVGLPDIQNIIHARADRDATAEAAHKDEIAAVFADVINSNPHYKQIRYIGIADNGREIVRVERRDGRIQRIPEDALQHKGDRPYFQSAITRPPHHLFFSNINLNREYGVVEVPYQPTLRIISAVHTPAGEPFGIVVVNLDFQSFIEDLFPTDPRYTYYLTNDKGDYLVHPDPNMTFGFDRGEQHRIQEDYPTLVTMIEPPYRNTATLRIEKGLTGIGDNLVHVRSLHVFPDEPARFILLGLNASYQDTGDDAVNIGLRVLLFTAVLVILALLIAYRLSALLVRPLEEITEATNRFAQGSRDAKLPLLREDEIGTLARSFDRMAGLVEDRNTRLEKANADLEHFAHITSHDLREPARRVVGLVDMLLLEEKERLSPEGIALLSRVHRSSRKMLDQITEFRVLARIGHGALVRTRTNLDTLLTSVLSEFANELEKRSVVVTVEDAPSMLIYDNLVHTLYRNLVINALKHTHGQPFDLTLTFSEVDGTWVCGVRNTGSHIDQDKLESVFAPFTRLLTSEGTGLGLSICRRIVERHSGRIWAESGSDDVWFKFTLGGGVDASSDSSNSADRQ